MEWFGGFWKPYYCSKGYGCVEVYGWPGQCFKNLTTLYEFILSNIWQHGEGFDQLVFYDLKKYNIQCFQDWNHWKLIFVLILNAATTNPLSTFIENGCNVIHDFFFFFFLKVKYYKQPNMWYWWFTQITWVRGKIFLANGLWTLPSEHLMSLAARIFQYMSHWFFFFSSNCLRRLWFLTVEVSSPVSKL